MPTISLDDKLTTVILIYKVDPQNQIALVNAAIENSQNVIEKKSGFISSNLHKSIDGTSIVNYLQWETRKLYEEAINSLSAKKAKIGEKILEITNSDRNIYELVFCGGKTPTKISKDTNLVTVINQFSVAPENQKILLQLLDKLRVVVEKQPGFISANVHRSLEGKHVLSYAQWETKEDYQAVYTNSESKLHLTEIKKISKFYWNFYEVVYTT